MALYRRKVTVIEAEQFLPHAPGGVPEGVQVEYLTGKHYVTTAHKQQVFLEPGDWVIAEPDGRGYYPVKDDIFQETYELVGGPENADADDGSESQP